jgi:uncharacterized membrane protein
MLVALGGLVVFTAVGLAVLWPRGERPELASSGPAKTQGAEVTSVRRVPCTTPVAMACQAVEVKLRSGPDKGERTTLHLGQTVADVSLAVGDRIRVARNPAAVAKAQGADPVDRYTFADFDRRSPMLWLAAAFVLLVLITGRLRGARALLGLGVSLAIILLFVVPAILDGRPPVAVAIVGSLAVMLTTIPLAHGLGAKAIAAALGTGTALLLTAGLASLVTGWAHLTGLSSDETLFVRAIAEGVSLEGLLLAGMVIGALGVLDDLTVSQASTVMALRRAAPDLGLRRLVREALDVGHDHIAATVNTLVLAYAGASLPVLLIFSIGGTPFLDGLNSETVADQVVAMLVGSIGLISAVPITTVLAAALAMRLPERSLAGAHAH